MENTSFYFFAQKGFLCDKKRGEHEVNNNIKVFLPLLTLHYVQHSGNYIVQFLIYD